MNEKLKDEEHDQEDQNQNDISESTEDLDIQKEPNSNQQEGAAVNETFDFSMNSSMNSMLEYEDIDEEKA